MREITDDLTKKYVENFEGNSKNKLAQNAVRKAARVATILMDPTKVRELNNVFTDRIDVKVYTTDQETSGRCWLFAVLNIIRLIMIQNYKLDEDFELSQAYPFFWDQFEKANFFLHNIIKYRKEAIDNQYNRIILKEPVSDGGQWNMVINIVNKYGLVPKNDMDETFHSSNTEQMKNFLNDKLREYAVEIRAMPDSYFVNDRSKLKERLHSMLYDIFKILLVFLGTPPSKVDWSFYQNIPRKKSNRKKSKSKSVIYKEVG